jgi:hypothetical protein
MFCYVRRFLVSGLFLAAAGAAHAVTPVVTTKAATGVMNTSAIFKGTIDPMGGSFQVQAEYRLTASYGYISSSFNKTYFVGTGVQACTFSNWSLAPNTTYHCRVTVTNGEGSSTGQDVSFTTLSPPTVITNAVGGVSATSAYLSGTYHMQNGNYSVSLEYGQTTAYGQTAASGQLLWRGMPVIIVVGAPITNATQNYSITQFLLLPETTYHYRLKLTDYYGTSYYGDDVTFTTISPVQAWRQQQFNTLQDAGSAADMACPAETACPICSSMRSTWTLPEQACRRSRR